jgi:hypothetical protein
VDSEIMSNTIAALAAIAAFCAALAAYAQIRTLKLLEMLKFIESRDVRAARRRVIREISNKTDKWWDADDELEAAATDVCAAYDILGRLIEADWVERLSLKGYSDFFQHWDYSISVTHDALLPFLNERRKDHSDRYSAFSRLAKAARSRLEQKQQT